MTDATRIYTLVVSALVILVGSPQLFRRLRVFMPENQLAWLALVGMNLSTLLGTVEVLHKHIDGGYRVPLVAASTTFALLAVCYRPGRWLWLRRWRLKTRRPKENP